MATDPKVDPETEALRAALTRLMAERKTNPRALSLMAGLKDTAVRDIMVRVANPRMSTLLKLAAALKVAPVNLYANSVPVVGTVGIGGAVEMAENGHDVDLVAIPGGIIGQPMAFRVEGDYLAPAHWDGDIVYIGRNGSGVKPELIGLECVAKLAHGGAYLKTLAKGSAPGRYALHQSNAMPMDDVELEWAERVQFTMKRPPAFV